MNSNIFVAKCTLLFTANSVVASYSGQFLYPYSIKNLKYFSNSWFIHSVCLSVCVWNDIDNLVSISNILFNSFVNFATNCSPLLLITLSSNLYNFYTLSLNSLSKIPSTNATFVVVTKYVIFDNLSHTTSIISFHPFLLLVVT